MKLHHAQPGRGHILFIKHVVQCEHDFYDLLVNITLSVGLLLDVRIDLLKLEGGASFIESSLLSMVVLQKGVAILVRVEGFLVLQKILINFLILSNSLQYLLLS